MALFGIVCGCKSKSAPDSTNVAGNNAPPADPGQAANAPADPIAFFERLCAAAVKNDAAYVKANVDLPIRFSLKTAPDKCGRATGKRCSNSVGMVRDAEGLATVCTGLEGIDPAKSDAASKAKLASALKKRVNDYRIPVTNGETVTTAVVARVEGRLRLVEFDSPKDEETPVAGGGKPY